MRMKRKVSLHPLKRFFKWEGLILLSAIAVFGCRKPMNKGINMGNKSKVVKVEPYERKLDVVPSKVEKDPGKTREDLPMGRIYKLGTKPKRESPVFK